MLSYRQFLFEVQFKYRGDHDGNGHYFVHKDDVGDHSVGITYSHRDYHPHGSYDVGYSVNGHMDRGEDGSGVHGHDAHKIIHHVHKSIHHFIREKKPHSLRFEPSDVDEHSEDHKRHVYHKLAKHLARHYGGKVEKDFLQQHGAAVVRFPHHA